MSKLRKSKRKLASLAKAMDIAAGRPRVGWSQGRGWRSDRGARVAAVGTPNKAFSGNAPNQGMENGQEQSPTGSDKASGS